MSGPSFEELAKLAAYLRERARPIHCPELFDISRIIIDTLEQRRRCGVGRGERG